MMKKNVKVYPVDNDENALQTVSIGPFFSAFVDDQKLGEGRSQFVAETADILAHCNPSVRNEPVVPAVHLALGYVQSGKTMSFMGLTALALDNNYRMVIYLAGVTNNLLEQTRKRLHNDLIKKRPTFRTNYKIYTNPDRSDVSKILNDLKSSCQRVVLLPVLKEDGRIEKLSDFLLEPSVQSYLRNKGVLVIDDEADQASLNALARINSKKGQNNKSATYRSILRLISALPGCSYVQYTATPQANLLIDINDILSPQSHTVLTPGKAYVGGKHFFGYSPRIGLKTSPCAALFGGKLVCKIPSEEVLDPKAKNGEWTELPESLQDALKMHILATALVVSWRSFEIQEGRCDRKPEGFLSMLVHVDRGISWNKKIRNWVHDEVCRYCNSFRENETTLDYKMICEEFRVLYPEAIKFYGNNETPSFDELVPHIKNVLEDGYVYLINSDEDADQITEEVWESRSMHILVGADMLNRGFTVEKLATTYMTRHTKSTPNADTVEQRCRFFGYKRNYIESCRIFLNETAIQYYGHYVESEEEMREYLRSCNRLESIAHMFYLNKSLKATRLNVLPKEVKSYLLDENITLWGLESDNFIDTNKKTIENFISNHLYNSQTDVVYQYANRAPHRGFNVSLDEAILLLKKFMVSEDVVRRYAVLRLLQMLDSSKHLVHVVEMDADIPGYKKKAIRSRTCDPGKMIPKSGLQEGRTSRYPGDAAIVDSDKITIQIYRLKLEDDSGKWPSNRPNEFASLLISVPELYSGRFVK